MKMKKSLLIVAVLALSLASCKKDRVCSCKRVTSYTGAGAKPADSVVDYEYTILKATHKTAFRSACIHTKTTQDYGTYVENTDNNCSLK